MKRFFLAIILLLSGIYAAAAQFNGCPPGFCNGGAGIGNSGGGFSNGSGPSAPPPVCSNQLDFSQACNSQYLL